MSMLTTSCRLNSKVLILVRATLPRYRSATFPQNQVQLGSVFASFQWNSVLGCNRNLLGKHTGKTSPVATQIHQISRLVSFLFRNDIYWGSILTSTHFSDCSCKEFQNLNAFFALVMGLSNVAVSRLTQTWERLPSKVKLLSTILLILILNFCLCRATVKENVQWVWRPDWTIA